MFVGINCHKDVKGAVQNWIVPGTFFHYLKIILNENGMVENLSVTL